MIDIRDAEVERACAPVCGGWPKLATELERFIALVGIGIADILWFTLPSVCFAVSKWYALRDIRTYLARPAHRKHVRVRHSCGCRTKADSRAFLDLGCTRARLTLEDELWCARLPCWSQCLPWQPQQRLADATIFASGANIAANLETRA
jgi:hypothetical protein